MSEQVQMRLRDSELASMIAPARRDDIPVVNQKELNKIAMVARLAACNHTVEEIANLCGCSPLRVKIILTSLKENAGELCDPPKGRPPKKPKVARRAKVAVDAAN